MSAFCVFGASLDVARQRAEKKVPTRIDGRLLSETEWRELVDVEAQAIFSRMAPVRVSPEFDAPQFCDDFLALAKRSGGGANGTPSHHADGQEVRREGCAKDQQTHGRAIHWLGATSRQSVSDFNVGRI